MTHIFFMKIFVKYLKTATILSIIPISTLNDLSRTYHKGATGRIPFEHEKYF